MNSVKHVAVILRGKPRTWNWTKTHIFRTIEMMFGNELDWYVAFWESTTVTEDSIFQDFEGRNLKSFDFIKENSYPIPVTNRVTDFYTVSRPDSYWRMAYLDQFLGYKKSKVELSENKIYDLVIFIRPDVLWVINGDNINRSNQKNLKMNPFKISTEMYEDHELDFEIVTDSIYFVDSLTADIIMCRFFDTFITDFKKQLYHIVPERALTAYLQRNGVTSSHHAYLNNYYHYIRPNMCGKNYNFIQDHKPWSDCNKEEKKEHCIRCGIDYEDYGLQK